MTQGLFIRADASASMGTGHVMRMLALAEAWREAGGAVTFGGAIPPALVTRLERSGASVVASPAGGDDAQFTVAAAKAAGASIVVADGYHFPLEYQRRVRALGARLLV
ncbi:MAG: hypothetical protein JNG84_03280, partial [Archangium sp.]|nr:hypothetical protein [Archangium sp.]